MSSSQAPSRKRKATGARSLLMIPMTVVLIGTQVPFLATIGLSFMKWEALYPNERGFAGFSNYLRVFGREEFRNSVWVTVALTVAVVVISLVLGIAFALMLNRKFFGRGMARTLMIAPFLFVPIASALLWKHIVLNPVYGLLNGVLERGLQLFGVHGDVGIAWLTVAPLAAIIACLVWQWTPFVMLIVLAGLQAVPADVAEAASIDGAGSFGRFWHITLPLLRPFIALAVLFCAINIVQNFDAVFTMTKGSYGTANIAFTVYRTFFQVQDYGMGAAMGVTVVGATLLLIFAGSRALRTLTPTAARG